MKPRAAAALPSHTGYSLKVLYGVHTEPQEVDGRVKAIILALLRDAHDMGVEKDTVTLVQFRLHDKQEQTWCRLEVLHGKNLSAQKEKETA